jgi:putative DNA primase/helicase
MRQDFFEFHPSHLLVMVTNHLPRVTRDDPALWDRLRVVPFSVTVTEPDLRLPERLSLELPAVLAWAMVGYRAYNAEGLGQPAAVTERTASYRAASDPLGRFLDERTITSRPPMPAPASSTRRGRNGAPTTARHQAANGSSPTP